MLYILDKSLLTVNFNSYEANFPIKLLLGSVMRGENLVIGKVPILKHLQNFDFHSSEKALLNKILSNSSELLSLMNGQLKYKINIVDSENNIAKVSDFEWNLSLNWIYLKGLPTTALLTEDTNDAELYRYCAEHYALKQDLKLKVFFETLNGGGSNIHRVFREQTSSMRKIVFCITDSDKYCQHSPDNTTSRQCVNVINETKWAVYHKVLASREIENILPFNIVSDAVYQNDCKDTIKRLDFYHNLLCNDTENFKNIYKFDDLKKGVAAKNVFAKECDCWSQRLQNSPGNKICHSLCATESNCKAVDAAACECKVTPGLSINMMNLILHNLKHRSLHDGFRRVVTSFNCDEWIELGRFIFSWGVASKKVRS